MKNEKWFGLSLDEIEKKLKTNAATGLSRKAARSRSAKGTESLYRTTRKRASKMILELFSDFTWVLLCIMFMCISSVAIELDNAALLWWYVLIPLVIHMKGSEKK